MDRKFYDDNGQPLNRNFSAKRLTNRTIDELIGLCKGMQADGFIHVAEAHFLANWLEKSREIIDIWPCNILAGRIDKIMEDGVVDEAEQRDLFDLLSEITGCNAADEIIDKSTGEILEGLSHMATLLPVDKPAPPITFKDKLFCLTGKFFYGARKRCEDEILRRGGQLQATPNKKTDYLVIGLLGSSDWKHSTHGTKIQYGVVLREKGASLAIVTEEHWASHL